MISYSPVKTSSSSQTSSMPKPNTDLPVSTIYGVEKFYSYTNIEIDQFNSSKELQQIY